MELLTKDYGSTLNSSPISTPLWNELSSVIQAMPLHLKASDQKGKQGLPIFDPVGTNEYFENELKKLGWQNKISIPTAFNFLGTDIDFEKNGVISEVQFSNYPFLLNNLLRTELFFRANLAFGAQPITSAVIITKGGMFPSSNSTLYYEQALHQLDALNSHGFFSVPIKLVGLVLPEGLADVIWTEYDDARYSRSISKRHLRKCEISWGNALRHGGNRCAIKFLTP